MPIRQPADRPADARERLILAAASALHANGQDTGETIASISRLSAALELPTILFPGWGDLAIQTAIGGGRTYLHAGSATPSGVSMNRVVAVMRCIDAVSARRVPLADAEAAISRAAKAPPAALPMFVLACVAGASALAVIFGALHPASLGIIALSAGAGAALRRALLFNGAGAMLQAFAAALLAGVVGALAVRFGVSSASRLEAICPCMILVPGPHLLNGALDLAALRIPLGAARLTFAGLVLLAICAGLLIGLALGGTTLPVSEPSQAVPLWVDSLAAGVAAACFGVFFSMPSRMLAWPALIGGVAHAVRWCAISVFGVGAASGAGIACLVVGALMAPVAKRCHLPFAAVGFASVVSLMPGIFIFRMSSALVQLQAHAGSATPDLAADALSDAVTTLLIVAAMTLGLAAPKHLYNRFIHPPGRKK